MLHAGRPGLRAEFHRARQAVRRVAASLAAVLKAAGEEQVDDELRLEVVGVALLKVPEHHRDRFGALRHRLCLLSGQEEEALAATAATHTSLTEWFKLNERDPEARQYTYSAIPEFYTWSQKTKTWTKRQQRADKVIGRMYAASPQDQERFYLYLILLHIRGTQK